jgi:AbrB family looped-hinge helix DNA binding protein
VIVELTPLLANGQITIPEKVRETLGLREGDLVAFVLVDGHWQIQRQTADLARFMRQIGQSGRPMTEEELAEIDASGRESEERWEKKLGI